MGSKGSGNWGHKGRKGKRGGSAPGRGRGRGKAAPTLPKSPGGEGSSRYVYDISKEPGVEKEGQIFKLGTLKSKNVEPYRTTNLSAIKGNRKAVVSKGTGFVPRRTGWVATLLYNKTSTKSFRTKDQQISRAGEKTFDQATNAQKWAESWLRGT